MTLYAATLRMIDSAHCMAEEWIKEWESHFMHPSDDGTIQWSIETLDPPAEHIKANALPRLNAGDRKFFDEALDIAYKQGYDRAIRDRVTFNFKGE